MPREQFDLFRPRPTPTPHDDEPEEWIPAPSDSDRPTEADEQEALAQEHPGARITRSKSRAEREAERQAKLRIIRQTLADIGGKGQPSLPTKPKKK